MTDDHAADLNALDVNDPNPPQGEDRLMPGGDGARR